MSTKPPRVVTAALVLPLGDGGGRASPRTRRCTPWRPRRSSAAASTSCLATERALGRKPGRAGVQQPRLRHPLRPRRRRPDPDRGQGPDRRRQGLLRHPQRGADRHRTPRRATGSRSCGSTRADPSTTRSAISTTRSRDQHGRLRRHRHPRRLGQDLGQGQAAILKNRAGSPQAWARWRPAIVDFIGGKVHPLRCQTARSVCFGEIRVDTVLERIGPVRKPSS